jgi:hypothetical protein
MPYSSAYGGQGWLSSADRLTHHALPLLPLRRGVILRAARNRAQLQAIRGVKIAAGFLAELTRSTPSAILRCAQDDSEGLGMSRVFKTGMGERSPCRFLRHKQEWPPTLAGGHP